MPLPENRLSFEQQRIDADLHTRRISGELEGKAKEFAERIHKIFNQNRQGLQSAASSSYSPTTDDNNSSSTEINQQINIVSSPTADSNIQQSTQQLRVEPLTDTSSTTAEQNNDIGKISPIIQSSISSLGSLGSNIISENLESIKETSESSNNTLSNLLSFFQTKEERDRIQNLKRQKEREERDRTQNLKRETEREEKDWIQNLKRETERESTSSLVSQKTTVVDDPSKPRPESKKEDADDDDDKKSKFRETIEGAGKAGFATLPPIVQVGLSSLGSGLMGLSGRFRRNRRTQNVDDGVLSPSLPQDIDSLPKDQKEYYENSQPIFEEIRDNTEESKNSLINLMNFLKGNDEVINNNEYEKKDHIESLKEETEKEKESLKIQSGNEKEKSNIVPLKKEEEEKEKEKTKKKKDESKFRETIKGAGKAGFATLPPIVQVGLSSLLIDPAMSLLGKKDKDKKKEKESKRKKTSEKSDVIKNDSKAISSRSEDLEITQQQEQSDSIVNDSRVKRQLSEEHRRKISEGLKQSRLRRETAPPSPTVVIVQQQENQNDTNVSKEIHSTQRDYIDNQKSQIEIQSNNREVQKEFYDSQNNFIESQKDFQSDQKEYYESSQVELQEIQNNTESTKSTLISLMDFFKGNELKEYEEKREEEIRNDRLISAIEDLSTIKSTAQQPEKEDDKKGIFALGALLGLKLKALGAAFLAFLPIIAKVALAGAALFAIFKLFGSDAMKDVVEKVKSVWNEQILPAFVGLKDALVDLWEKGLKTFVVDTIANIGATISGIVEGITQIFRGDFRNGILTIIRALVTGIKNQFDNVLTGIARIFGFNFFEGDGSVFKFAERKIGEAQQWIIDKFDGMIEGIKNLFDKITGAIKNIPLPAWVKRRLGIEEDEQTEEERLISEREELQRRIQNIEFAAQDAGRDIGRSDQRRIERYQNEIAGINEQLEAGPETVIPEPDSIEELPIRPEQSAAFTAQAIERAREDFPEVRERSPEELEQQREEIRQRNEELVQRIEIDSQLRNQRIESAQQTVDGFTAQIEEKNEEIDRLLSIAETRALTRQELGLKANLENQVQTYQNIIDQQKAEIERLSAIEEETIGVVNDDTSETVDRRVTLNVPISDTQQQLEVYREQYQEANNLAESISKELDRFDQEYEKIGSGRSDFEGTEIMVFADPEIEAQAVQLRRNRMEALNQRQEALTESRRMDGVVPTSGMRRVEESRQRLRNNAIMIETLKTRFGYSEEELQQFAGGPSPNNFIQVGNNRYSNQVIGLYNELTQRELQESQQSPVIPSEIDTVAPSISPVSEISDTTTTTTTPTLLSSETTDRKVTLDVPSDTTSIAPAAEQQPSTRGSLTPTQFQELKESGFLTPGIIRNYYEQNPDKLIQKSEEFMPQSAPIGMKAENYIATEYSNVISSLRSSSSQRQFIDSLRVIAQQEQANQRSLATVPDNDIEGVIPPSRIDISVPAINASDSLYEADTTRLETPFRMDTVEPIPIEPVPVSEPLMMQQGQRTQLQEQVEMREAENAREGGIGGIQQVNNYNSSNSTTQVIRPSPSPTSRIESAQDIYSMPQMVPF